MSRAAKMKLQLSTSKLQRSTNPQSPKRQVCAGYDWSLKFGSSLMFGCWSLMIFNSSAITSDSTAQNPYQPIVDRNIFGLKDPPPPPNPDDLKPKVQGPKITLTGIITFGSKRALMKAIMPGKPGEGGKPAAPAEQSFMLAEGQAEDQIEVIAIDEKAGTVKVNNFGTEQTLNFTDNGLKPPVAAAVAGGPAPGGVPQPYRPAGIAGPGASGNANGAGGFNNNFPPRPPRFGGGSPNPQAGNNPQGTLGGAAAIPAPVLPGNASIPSQTELKTIGGFPTSTGMTPEQNVLMYEANRLKNEELRKAGVMIPRMPVHPSVRGLVETPDTSQPLPQ